MWKYGLALGGRGRLAGIPLLVLLLFAGPLALACTIEQAREFHEGTHKGLKGTCSNSGLEVSCIDQGTQGYACSGPDGNFQGSDLATLVFSACGCGGG